MQTSDFAKKDADHICNYPTRLLIDPFDLKTDLKIIAKNVSCRLWWVLINIPNEA